MSEFLDSCLRAATDPGVASHIRDVLHRSERELTAIAASQNTSRHRCLASVLVRRMFVEDPVEAAEALRLVDLILEYDESVRGQH